MPTTSGAIQKAEQDCSCRWVFQFSSSAQAGEMLITSYISIDKISQAMIFLLPIICEVNIQKQSNTVELSRQAQLQVDFKNSFYYFGLQIQLFDYHYRIT